MTLIATLGATIETKDAKDAMAVFKRLTGEANTLEVGIRSLRSEVTKLSAALKTLGGTGSIGGSIGTVGSASRIAAPEAAKLGQTLTTVGAAAGGAAVGMDRFLGGMNRVRIAGLRFRTDTNRGATALNLFGTAAERAQERFRRFAQSSTSHAEGFMGVVIRLAAIFGSIQLALSGIRTIAGFEDIRDTFAALNGSSAAGNRRFDFARRFARTSPQTLEEVSSAMVGLQNNNIEPTEDLLRLFSDVASVTSDQRGAFAQLVKLWQRGQQGGLGVEELDILGNRGVNIYGIIQERMGLSRREVGDFAQDSTGAKQVVETLKAGFEELYGGASLRRLDNLSVKWNAFVDTAKEAAEAVGVGLGRTMHRTLDGLTGALKRGTSGFETLGAGIGHVVNVITLLAQAFTNLNNILGGGLLYALTAVGAAMTGAGILKVLSFISPYGFVKGAIGGGLTRGRDMLGRVGGIVAGLREMREGVGLSQGTVFARAGFIAQRKGDGVLQYTRDELKAMPFYLLGYQRALGGMSRQSVAATLATTRLSLSFGALVARLGPLAWLIGGAGIAGAAIKGGSIVVSLAAWAKEMVSVGKVMENLTDTEFTFREVWAAHNERIGETATRWDKARESMRSYWDALTRSGLDPQTMTIGGTPVADIAASWHQYDLRNTASPAARRQMLLDSRDTAYLMHRQRVRLTGDPEVDAEHVAYRAAQRAMHAAGGTPVSIMDFGPSGSTMVQGVGIVNQSALGGSWTTAPGARIDGRVGVGTHLGVAQSNIPFRQLPGGFQGSARSRWTMDNFRDTDAYDAQGWTENMLDFRLATEEAQDELRELMKELRNFTDTLNSAWTSLVDNVRKGTHSFKEGVRDFFDELGRDLHHRILDHYLGKPIKQFFQNLMANIFEGITNWRGLQSRTGGLFQGLLQGFGPAGTIAGSVGASTGVLSTINVNSFDGGGFTGSGARVGGVDGRGGFFMIGHPNETVIDHEKGGLPISVVVNNNAAGADVSVNPAADGRGVEVMVEDIMANAVQNGGKFNRQLQQNFNVSRRV